MNFSTPDLTQGTQSDTMNLEFMSPQAELPGNVSRLHTSSSVPLDKPLKEKTTGSRVYVQV